MLFLTHLFSIIIFKFTSISLFMKKLWAKVLERTYFLVVKIVALFHFILSVHFHIFFTCLYLSHSTHDGKHDFETSDTEFSRSFTSQVGFKLSQTVPEVLVKLTTVEHQASLMNSCIFYSNFFTGLKKHQALTKILSFYVKWKLLSGLQNSCLRIFIFEISPHTFSL